MRCPAGPVVLKANQMPKLYISLFHHRGGVSVAVLQTGQDATKYWIDKDGHEPADAEEYIESVDLPEPYASAPELLTAMKTAVEIMYDYGIDESMIDSFNVFTDAINNAEGKNDESR
jgi:hypothetical protein